MIESSELDKRLIIERPAASETADDHGGPDAVFIEVAEVWARIEGVSGREFLAARQLVAEATHRIAIRYRQDIKPTWRGKWRGSLYDFVHVAPVAAQREYIEILAVERNPVGLA